MTVKHAKPASRTVAATKASRAVATTQETSKKPAGITTKAAMTNTTSAKNTVAKKTVSTVVAAPKAKAPAARKAAVSEVVASAAEKRAAEKKMPARKATGSKSPLRMAEITPADRHQMVQMAAYFIAERHGFGGNPALHWADAEREIAAKLGG